MISKSNACSSCKASIANAASLKDHRKACRTRQCHETVCHSGWNAGASRAASHVTSAAALGFDMATVHACEHVYASLSRIGFTAPQLTQLVRDFPPILNSPNVDSAIAALHSMDIRGRTLQQLIRACPPLLQEDVRAFIAFMRDFGASVADVRRIVIACPVVLLYPLYHIGSTIAFLRSLALTDKDVVSVLKRQPRVLIADVACQLERVACALLQHGCAMSTLRTLITLRPDVLCCDVDVRLQHILEFLSSKDGASLSPIEARDVIARWPNIILFDVDTVLAPNVAFLRQHIGLSEQQCRAVLQRMPMVLSMPLPLLQRKWQFMRSEMLCSADALASCPSYLAAPLLTHVGPRFSFLHSHGHHITSRHDQVAQRAQHGEAVDLAWLVGCGTDEFCRTCEASVKEFEDHAAQWRATEGSKWCGSGAVF